MNNQSPILSTLESLKKSLNSFNNHMKQVTNIKLNLKDFKYQNELLLNKTPYYENNYSKNETNIISMNTLHPEFKRNLKNWDYKNREVLIKFQLYKEVQYYNFQDLEYYLGVWTRQLFHNLSQQAFFGYCTEKLTEEQCKYFFSNNLILNQIRLIRFFKKKFQKIWEEDSLFIIDLIEKQSSNALEFLLKDYPEKKSIYVDPSTHRLIPEFNQLENPEHDLLKNIDQMFQYPKQKKQHQIIYEKKIKQILNKLVQLTNKDYDKFSENINKIFDNENLKLISHKIGRKLSKQTPTYTQNQLKEPGLQIKSPQLMRVIIKWIEGLEQRITNLQKYINKRPYKFINRNKKSSLIRFSDLQKFHVVLKFQSSQDIKKINSSLKNSLHRIGKVLTILPQFIDKNQSIFNCIQQHKIETGLSTYALESIITDIVVGYLISLIQNILQFQQKMRKQNPHYIDKSTGFNQSLYINKFAQVSYISLGVYDLLRAKCQGSREQIQQIYNLIKLQDSGFKIIRVKNRLATGNRDFLLNMRMDGSPLICQLQLGLKSGDKQNKKQQYFDHFNHYLYQLSRSKFGALAQAVILNNHISSSSISYFQKKLHQKYRKDQQLKKIQKGIEYQIHQQKKIGFKIKQQSKNHQLYMPWNEMHTFICENCLFINTSQNSWIPSFCYKPSTQKKNFQKHICSSCFFNTQFPFQSKQRKDKLLGHYSEFYQEIKPQDIKKYKTGYFFIIPKSKIYTYSLYFKLQDKFFKSISENISENESKKKILSIQQLNILFVYKLKNIRKSKNTALYYQLDHESQFFMKQHLIELKSPNVLQFTSEYTMYIERVNKLFEYYTQFVEQGKRVMIKSISLQLKKLFEFQWYNQNAKIVVITKQERNQQNEIWVSMFILDLSPDVYYKIKLKNSISKQIIKQNDFFRKYQQEGNTTIDQQNKIIKQNQLQTIKKKQDQQKKKIQAKQKKVVLDFVDKIIINQNFLIDNIQQNQYLFNKITQLYLGNNQIRDLSFITPILANNLVNLNLRKNFIQGPLIVQPEFVNLININLSQNMFKTFDNSGLKFKCLKQLILSYNQLTEVNIQNIVTLKYLNISNNLFTESKNIKIGAQVIKSLKTFQINYSCEQNHRFISYLFNRVLTPSQKQQFNKLIQSSDSFKKNQIRQQVKIEQKLPDIFKNFPYFAPRDFIQFTISFDQLIIQNCYETTNCYERTINRLTENTHLRNISDSFKALIQLGIIESSNQYLYDEVYYKMRNINPQIRIRTSVEQIIPDQEELIGL